jgi:site-specific recombinase XerD
MGKLYERMCDDLKLRNYSGCTLYAYPNDVKRFVAHFMRPPEDLHEEHVREFMLHLQNERKVSPATQHCYLAAIKFFYRVTLGRPEVVESIPFPKLPKTLHDTLSRQEVEHILGLIRPIKHRTILMASYGAGLRISEACALQFGDIDRQQRLIHVRKGKGDKDRYVMLGERLLHILVEYYKHACPPGPYFFPGLRPDRPIDPKRPSTVLRRACDRAGIVKHVTTHSLRHAFATHLIEAGTDVRVVQLLLGHRSIETTMLYTRVSAKHIARVKSPLDMQEDPTTPTPR